MSGVINPVIVEAVEAWPRQLLLVHESKETFRLSEATECMVNVMSRDNAQKIGRSGSFPRVMMSYGRNLLLSKFGKYPLNLPAHPRCVFPMEMLLYVKEDAHAMRNLCDE